MPLPDSIAAVTVTGRFLTPDGRPLAGTVVFRPPGLLTFAEDDVLIAGPVSAPLNENTGAFSVTLPATDAAGMDPSGWSYTVTEQLTGVASNRSYQILLPAESPAVDLADLAPTDPTTPTYVAVRGDSAYKVAVEQGFVGTEAEWLASLVGPPGADGADGADGVVQSVNGYSAAAVVLDAGDVGALPDTGVVAGGDLYLDSTGGPDFRGVNFRTDTLRRWVFQVDNGAESGGDAGSDFELTAWTDADTWKASVLYGKRATGDLGIGTNTLLGGAKATINGAAGLVDLAADPAAPTGGALLYSKGGAVYVRQADGATVPVAGGGTGAAAVARNTWTPQALGFQAWSVDPAAVANPTTLKAATVQRLYFAGVNITEPTTVNNVVMFARGWAGSTAVPAARFYAGIYDEAGALLATSGEVADLPAAGQLPGTSADATNNHIGAVPVPLTAAAVLQPGRYWCAFLMSAGGTSDFYYMHVQNEAPSNPSNFFLGDTFQRAWYLPAQTSLPASVDQSTGNTNHDPAIMALANL